MFLFLLNYDNGLELVEKHLEAHRKYLDKHYALNHFICSGAQIPRTGGVILCNAADRDEAMEIIKEDPFYQNDAVRYEIIEFTPNKYATDFSTFVNR
jgi:uncharacterized protein YciI